MTTREYVTRAELERSLDTIVKAIDKRFDKLEKRLNDMDSKLLALIEHAGLKERFTGNY